MTSLCPIPCQLVVIGFFVGGCLMLFPFPKEIWCCGDGLLQWKGAASSTMNFPCGPSDKPFRKDHPRHFEKRTDEPIRLSKK